MNRHGITLVALENTLFLTGCAFYFLALAELGLGHRFETGACYTLACAMLWTPAWLIARLRVLIKRRDDACERLRTAIVDNMAEKALMAQAVHSRQYTGDPGVN